MLLHCFLFFFLFDFSLFFFSSFYFSSFYIPRRLGFGQLPFTNYPPLSLFCPRKNSLLPPKSLLFLQLLQLGLERLILYSFRLSAFFQRSFGLGRGPPVIISSAPSKVGNSPDRSLSFVIVCHTHALISILGTISSIYNFPESISALATQLHPCQNSLVWFVHPLIEEGRL